MKFNSEVYGKVYHPQETQARQADGFIKKPEPKQESEAKQDPEPEAKQDPEPEAKQDPEPEAKQDPEPDLDGTGGD